MSLPLMLTDWVTVGEVENSVNQVMKTQNYDMRGEDAERMSALVAKSIVLAEADIIPLLTRKGYSISGLDDWVHKGVVLNNQSVFRYLISSDALSSVMTDQKIKEFDWRETIADEGWMPLGSNGYPVVIDNAQGGGTDGVNNDGIVGKDLFGGSRLAVGRLSNKYWEVRRDTRF